MTTRTGTRKPTIRKGPASSYEDNQEVIREFSDGRSGGLIAIRRNQIDDVLDVLVYQQDPDVTISVGVGPGTSEVDVQEVVTFLRNTIAQGPNFGDEWTVVNMEQRGANLELTLDDASVVQLAITRRPAPPRARS